MVLSLGRGSGERELEVETEMERWDEGCGWRSRHFGGVLDGYGVQCSAERAVQKSALMLSKGEEYVGLKVDLRGFPASLREWARGACCLLMMVMAILASAKRNQNRPTH